MDTSKLSATAKAGHASPHRAEVQRANNETWNLPHVDHQFGSATFRVTYSYRWQSRGNYLLICLPVSVTAALLGLTSGQVLCWLAVTTFSLDSTLNHSVRTKEIIMPSLFLKGSCHSCRITLDSDSYPSSSMLLWPFSSTLTVNKEFF